MDLSCFQSPEVTPMLVKLYDKHKLYQLSQEEKPVARAELSKTVCSILEMHLSEREMEMIADVLIALLRQAEIDLREALAERLAILENVPLRLVLEMVNDEISVARPLLKSSEVLKDDDLVYIIKSKNAAYWRVIACRKRISEKVVDVLADTKDVQTALSLVENNNIKLTAHTLAVLSDIAQENEKLAQPLLRRDEITPDLAKKLYSHVGEALKKYVVEEFGLNDEVMSSAIDGVINQFASKDNLKPCADVNAQAEAYRAKGLLNEGLMIQTLKRGQYRLFVSLFAKFAGMTPETVLEILHQADGKNLAIACRANGVLKADFISIFLLTNHFRTSRRQIPTQVMADVLQYFEQMKPHLARKIMESSMIPLVTH